MSWTVCFRTRDCKDVWQYAKRWLYYRAIAGERAIFIDESGDSEHNLILSAVVIPAAIETAARAMVDKLVEDFSGMLPGFALEQEFKATRLARPLRPNEIESLAGSPPFRTHERQFVYQHALWTLGDIPGVRVNTVVWRWKGRFAPPGKSGGRRFRTLLGRLLEWITEEPWPIASCVIDKGGQEPYYRQAIERVQAERGETWVVSMPDSKDDRLVQMADLAAFAAFQASTPGKTHSHASMTRWYRDALGPVFGEGGDGYGLRHFGGEHCAPLK